MILLFLLIYFLIIVVVIEIHVILFRLTGLKLEVSRFQVISMMTGTGFTTGESELILGHPVRRKLAAFLILFGAFSLAVLISSISNLLSNEMSTKDILVVAGILLLAFVVLKLTCVQRLLTKLFHQKMKQNVNLGDLPVREVFLTNKEDYMLNLYIYQESRLFHHTIGQIIKEHEQMDFVILFIKRGDLKIRKNVYHTKFNEGDQLFLFGARQVIHEKFNHDLHIMEKKLKDHHSKPFGENAY
ncbi:hypothetical protein [Bacillus sp. EB600]|uniref:hypothetical protein n=1 Tax=Bacillus sp. EB600 TaxID=2806345 RepID=UPI0021098242|nr:hypothetical protein [Bacillus sp. EB600]MCQ6282752.1 hypothetical protein [Bacillus sp. EB600]